jgi:hypothetical protein
VFHQVFNVGDLVIHADDQKEHKIIGVVSMVERDDISLYGDVIKVDWLNNNGDSYRFRARKYRAIAIAKFNEVTLASSR